MSNDQPDYRPDHQSDGQSDHESEHQSDRQPGQRQDRQPGHQPHLHRNQEIICTTPWSETWTQKQAAQTLAAWFACPYVPRRDRSVQQLCTEESVDAVLVADKIPKVYTKAAPDTPVFFHPGMALLRIQNLRRGETDRLVAAAGIEPGQVVLDCTLGGAADTLTLAYAVGPQGRVYACEVEPVLANLFAYAKDHGFQPYDELQGLADRIIIIQKHHLDWLRSLPDGFADVVYFDPMFRAETKGRSASMDALRTLTHPEPLSVEAIEEAKRIARRCVVVKERPMSGEFRRLGLTPDRPRNRVAYGVWKREEARV